MGKMIDSYAKKESTKFVLFLIETMKRIID